MTAGKTQLSVAGEKKGGTGILTDEQTPEWQVHYNSLVLFKSVPIVKEVVYGPMYAVYHGLLIPVQAQVPRTQVYEISEIVQLKYPTNDK